MQDGADLGGDVLRVLPVAASPVPIAQTGS